MGIVAVAGPGLQTKAPGHGPGDPVLKAEGPWARPRAQEGAVFAALVADSRYQPFRRQGPLGSSSLLVGLGLLLHGGTSGSLAGFHARGCKECSLGRLDGATRLTDCEYKRGVVQPQFQGALRWATTRHLSRRTPTSWPAASGTHRRRSSCSSPRVYVVLAASTVDRARHARIADTMATRVRSVNVSRVAKTNETWSTPPRTPRWSGVPALAR